ncbi:MAG TPA: redoxin domain-containing protein [Conexivisphaerales archaeon]|nr:redoxin domain-containing protein [Conexivisphaerales archaeon]
MPLVKGDRAPRVSVEGPSSEILLPFQGSTSILFFYPTNQGRTCVTEIADFDRLQGQFAALGIRVVGVTTEAISEIADLKGSKGLSVSLFSDPSGRASEAYGVRNAYGFADRFTFLISGEGTILAMWQAYVTEGHADEVLRYCRRSPAP